MNTSHPGSNVDELMFCARLEKVHAAIEAARMPDREGPYGLFDYTDHGDPAPHHVRDFRNPDGVAYGKCVFRSVDREEARQVYERLTAEHVAIAAVKATLKVLGLTPLRHQSVNATAEQRDKGRAGPLYPRGDMQLIWVNVGCLHQHDMIPDPSEMGAMAAIGRTTVDPEQSEVQD